MTSEAAGALHDMDGSHVDELRALETHHSLKNRCAQTMDKLDAVVALELTPMRPLHLGRSPMLCNAAGLRLRWIARPPSSRWVLDVRCHAGASGRDEGLTQLTEVAARGRSSPLASLPPPVWEPQHRDAGAMMLAGPIRHKPLSASSGRIDRFAPLWIL